jgi:hypothetical protein
MERQVWQADTLMERQVWQADTLMERETGVAGNLQGGMKIFKTSCEIFKNFLKSPIRPKAMLQSYLPHSSYRLCLEG